MPPAVQLMMLEKPDSGKPLTFANRREYDKWKRENFGDG